MEASFLIFCNVNPKESVYFSVNQLHILLLQLASHVFIFDPLCFMMDEEHKSILNPTDI
jgi:hypothetical protein